LKKTINLMLTVLLLMVFLAGCATDAPAKMATIDDVATKRIGVYVGTIYDKFAVNRFPKATILRYNSISDFVLALKNQKIDVAISNLYSAKNVTKTNPKIGILTDDLLSFPIGIGFNKGNPVLREKFNAFLKDFKSGGSFDTMYHKWFDNEVENVKMPKFEPNRSGQKLVLGVAVGDLPSVGYVNGKYVGFDVELLQTFAQSENLNLQIVTMEFGGLIAALAAGKVDLIADCIAITEERKKKVAFSDPYMEDKSALIALKANLADETSTVTMDEITRKKVGVLQGPADSFWRKIAASFYNNIILENRYLLILDGLKTTAVISIFAILFGTLLGALICFLRMSRRKAAALLAKLYIALLRGLPVLVLLMLIFYVVFAKVNLDPVLVAVIAFGMNFAAYVAEMFRTAIGSVDKGQTEAGIAGGFTKTQTFIYIVMPQAVRQVLPVYKGELISLVKATSIVGYIAVQDLTKASDIIRSRTFDAFFPLIMTAVLYFAICGLLLVLLTAVERKIDPKRRRNAAPQNPMHSTPI
jgi:polar amino acid transport system substrate-binding protein